MSMPPPLLATTPAQPSRGKRINCLIAILMVFVFIGPPVGALAFMLTVGLIGMGAKVDLIGLSWIGLFALIYAAPLSYFIGAGPAAVGGLIFGVRQAFFGPVRWPVAALIGIGVGVGFLVISGHSLPSMLADSEQPEYIPVMVITCLAATVACWAIVRTWHFAPNGRAGATT
ncbi:MAG: hypothetical protein M9932_16260 [Xanthobacteraceae bacterium]|nr:hypothetical protein [Xanthobacteraceae bacterium]